MCSCCDSRGCKAWLLSATLQWWVSCCWLVVVEVRGWLSWAAQVAAGGPAGQCSAGACLGEHMATALSLDSIVAAHQQWTKPEQLRICLAPFIMSCQLICAVGVMLMVAHLCAPVCGSPQVDAVLAQRAVRSLARSADTPEEMEYLVAWKELPLEQATWETAAVWRLFP